MSEKLKPICAICGSEMKGHVRGYPNKVCRECDKRAVNIKGEKPKWGFTYFFSSDEEYQQALEEARQHHNDENINLLIVGDTGENPVFIDGKKCWRRYRFGGYVTMMDIFDCDDEIEFHRLCIDYHKEGQEKAESGDWTRDILTRGEEL